MKIDWSEASTKRGIIWVATAVIGSVFVFMGKPVDQLLLLAGGQLTLIPTGIFATTTAGNIALATTTVVSKALIMTYDATTTKWYPSY